MPALMLPYFSTIQILGITTDVCFELVTEAESAFTCSFEIDKTSYNLLFKKVRPGTFVIDSVESALFTYSMDEFNLVLSKLEAHYTMFIDSREDRIPATRVKLPRI